MRSSAHRVPAPSESATGIDAGRGVTPLSVLCLAGMAPVPAATVQQQQAAGGGASGVSTGTSTAAGSAGNTMGAAMDVDGDADENMGPCTRAAAKKSTAASKNSVNRTSCININFLTLLRRNLISIGNNRLSCWYEAFTGTFLKLIPVLG
ncbi:hypothetical protein B0H16DRAFT_1716679 [Mycena metata]|uniref:Uncharacterized protein n=1 Tax=Mycena metata TaxID=1033252 RepID=A0AAD7NMN4_9AGAR|nr:hypothetical protein B0H16DRAFT_1716679 [Mycena metata]